ncbi:MAG: alcohol dehydrogenase catalytic domain-containing protein [Ignisphaera sp.]
MSIPSTHKVAFVREFGKPLSIEEVPTPKPKGTEVLVKISGAGICHTDVHVWEGVWKPAGIPPRLPWIISHELTGIVVDKGEKVPDTVKVGQKVLIFAWGWSEEDVYVWKGYSNLTDYPLHLGVWTEGGLREYFLVPHYRYLVDVEGIDDLPAAAPLGCAGLTTYRVVKKAKNVLEGDDYVVVVGVGGLGMYALKWLNLLAPYTNVIAVDVRDEVLEFASKRARIDHLINASKTDPVSTIMEITSRKGAKVVIDTVGIEKTVSTYYNVVGKTGVFFLVGMGGVAATIAPLLAMSTMEKSISGIVVGTLPEQIEVVNLAKKGKINYKDVISKRLKIEEATEALEAIRHGKALGRQIVVFP